MKKQETGNKEATSYKPQAASFNFIQLDLFYN